MMSADNNTDDHRRHYDPDEDDSAMYSNGNDHPSIYRNSYNDTEDQYSNDKSDYYQAPEQYPTQKPSVYDTDHDYDDAVDNNTYHTGNDNNTYRNDNNTYHNNDSDTYYNENDNTPQYRDDRQYDDYRDHDNNNDDDEQNALFRPRDGHDPHQKTTCGQKMKRCCQTCHQPKCQYRGPCHFPHGCCYSVMGIMSAVGGLMMNLYVIGTCLFQRIQQINHVTGDVIPGSQRGYGFLSRETDYGLESDYRQCTWYTQDEYDDIYDGWMKSGRFFAFLSAILATVCFIVMMMTCCFAFSRSMFEKWLFWMYIAAAILVALSFFIFGNEYCQENDCKVADGCGWAISAFMFHLLAANTVKSFPIANPPKQKRPWNRRNRNADPGHDDDDEDDDDDLYYETEEDKYPPTRPEGPRGVKIDKDGVRTFDDGEDYFNDMGEMIDPYDPEGLNKKKSRRADDEDYDDENLDDVSDHDLEEYASDNDDDDDDEYNDEDRTRKSNKTQHYDANGNPISTDDDEVETMYDIDVDDATQGTRQTLPPQQYDAHGQPIFDPDMVAERGNLGVGYDDNVNDSDVYFDEYGRPVPPHPPQYGNGVNGVVYEDQPPPPPQQQQQHQEPLFGYDDFGNTNYNFDRASNDTNENEMRNNPFEAPPMAQQPRMSFSSDDHNNDHDDDTRSHQSYETYGSDYPNTNSYHTNDAIHPDDPAMYNTATHLGQEGSNRRYSNVDDDDDSHGPVFT